MLHFARTSITQCSHISTVAVIGGGQMGSGIAQVVAGKGYNVSIIDVNEDAFKKSRNTIHKHLSTLAKKSKKENAEKDIVDPIMERILFSLNLEEEASKADLVIEAVVEDLKLKQKIFKAIDKVASEQTIFGTNTSSIVVKDIASATNRQDRFAGLHFFNPVSKMKLVELVRTNEVSDSTYDTLKEWIRSIDKVPIPCKDSPGFIVNRLLVPFLLEAVRMYERGDAELKDIDEAIKLGCNHPMGPIELLDWVGLDTVHSCAKGWREHYPNHPLFEPLESLIKLVEEGKLGVKTEEAWRELYPNNPLFEPLKSQIKLVEEGKLGFKTGEGYYKYK